LAKTPNPKLLQNIPVTTIRWWWHVCHVESCRKVQ
jgi:hypothetical protein